MGIHIPLACRVDTDLASHKENITNVTNVAETGWIRTIDLQLLKANLTEIEVTLNRLKEFMTYLPKQSG